MTTDADDPFDGSLIKDIALIDCRIRERRRLLGLLLSGGTTALLVGCGGSDSTSISSSSSSSSSFSSSGSSSSSGVSSACVADPAETNGPFPADGTNSVNGSVVDVLTQSGIVRSDITSSFGSSSTVAAGVPLTLTITLSDSSTACSELIDYAIYIWHCNRDGEYSLYSSGIQGENYLRGVQTTDSNAQVIFRTLFPACYSGRYPHIHVEIYKTLALATGQVNAILTTQFAMPRDICSTVYNSATGYSASVTNLAAVTTSSDSVFGSSTSAQLAAQTPVMSGSVADGYTATVTVGVA
jgi:protocatechuate 3,4-dioxygenase beta subunit